MTYCNLTSPTRANNTLDLVFTPNVSVIISNVRVSMPVCASDHSTVSFNLCSIRNTNPANTTIRDQDGSRMGHQTGPVRATRRDPAGFCPRY